MKHTYEQKELELVPPGTYKAVCVGIFDLGIQVSKNPKHGPAPKVLFRWEIEKKMTKGSYAGKRFCVSKWYNNFFSPKAILRKDLESWRGLVYSKEEAGSGWDDSEYLGQSCLLAVSHNVVGDKTYVNVTSISPLMEGQEPLIPDEMLKEAPDWVKTIQDKAITEEPVLSEEDDLPC